MGSSIRGAMGIGMLALLAACLPAAAVECEDGRFCPSGTVCRVDGCVLEDAVGACATKSDRDPCSYTGFDGGVCADGVCVTPGCGNRLVENDEACDDGNTVGEDGCSSDCASAEVCGNEVADPLVGEQCDAGAGLSGDGCASACVIEIPVWELWAPEALWGETRGPALVYDERHRRLLAYAPSTSLDPTLLWVHERGGWRPVLTETTPPDMFGAAVAYDAGRGNLVLFGSASGGAIAGDTWLFDGTDWTQLATSSAPPPRRSHAMTYERARDRIVLVASEGPESETWTFDGVDWTPLPETLPSQRFPRLGYDEARERVVVSSFEGSTTTAAIWELVGDAWVRVTAPGEPSNVVEMTYDPIGERLLGIFAEASEKRTFAYDGTAWTELPFTSGGGNLALAFDRARGLAVHLDGFGAVHPDGGQSWFEAAEPQTFELVGDVWREVPKGMPPHYENVAMAYDARFGEVVMFGGQFRDGDATYDETWTFDGGGWRWRQPSDAPSRRHSAGLVYDVANARVVLFGGRDLDQAWNDTWIWDGETWTELVTTGAPSPRYGHGMAYDAARERIVLFGGRDFGAATANADTWVLAGDTWTELATAGEPPPRFATALAYDAGRDALVMYGGQFPDGDAEELLALGDTWELVGDTWTEHTGPGPGARHLHAMAYDVAFGDVVMTDAEDAWSFDGAWHEILTREDPLFRQEHDLAYDAINRQLVAYGGYPAHTVILRRDSPLADVLTPEESCVDAAVDDDGDGLTGCADPDCWARCAPACPPRFPCDEDAPHCGDGVCDLELERDALCPEDCDVCGDGACATGFESSRTCASDCGD